MSLPRKIDPQIHKSWIIPHLLAGLSPIWRTSRFSDLNTSQHISTTSQLHLNYISSFLLNPSKGHPNVGSPVARWPHTSGRTGASADGPVPSRPRWCAASPPRCAAAMRSVLAPELRQVAPGHPGPAQAGQPKKNTGKLAMSCNCMSI